MICFVVLDIEGTTSSLAFVRGTLFPYSRSRLPGWLAEHEGMPEVERALAETRRLAGTPDAGIGGLVVQLREWIDHDVKAAPLKTLQGLMWREAFQTGELTAHVYPDVRPVLSEWMKLGLRIHTYSSGSVAAQRIWFEHSPEGNLLPYLSGHFDLENAGPKHAPASYHTIAAAIEGRTSEVLFLSDVRAELDAACASGMHTAGVRRDGAPPIGGGHAEVTSLAELELPVVPSGPAT